MYHVTDFKKYDRCPRLFWLSQREKKPYTTFVQHHLNMMDLCSELLMIQDPFQGEVNDDPCKAIQALATHQWLLNARFAYEDLRVKIPILLQENGKRIAYFPYAVCYPKEGEALKLADTLAVMELINVPIDEVYVIHLRGDYVREDELDVRALLMINDHLYNGKNHPTKAIKDLLVANKRDVKERLAQLRACNAQEDIQVKRNNACTKGLKCVYFQECFPEKLNDTDILNLVACSKKYEMREEGIGDIKDVDVERIEGTRHQYAQIMAAKNGSYVDQAALRSWCKDHIQYPLSYLDFEWETYAYPPYKGMKPFDVLCFQYSLHVEQVQGAQLQHTSFLELGDCRIAFIEALVNDLPTQGTILVYNMEGAEKLRLRQLAEQFPQYEEQLRSIWERMVDLSLPFSTGNLYDNRMAGFFSLKTLVPIYSTYDYHDLPVADGLDAVVSYRRLQEAPPADYQLLKKQMENYCAMDTYAEYIVYHAIEALAWQ